ncbi:glycosyltransferase family 4 protein [Pandoraea pulmonicola]|uniref:glycosyltransferase family 4 protein n=1 Tax=Pandoraea pulmonicola TaxID=93221 RepID=UPI00135AA8F6|nr:glycosyltransferase family 4 protein [Pandoraea pulmonicola]
MAIVANTAWYLVNFRLNLMKELQRAGHSVVAVSSDDSEQVEHFKVLDVPFEAVAISGSGTNPLREAISVWGLFRALRKHRIDVVLSYTPKGNIYAGLAATMAGVAIVPNVSGLGRAFIRESLLTGIVKVLYRVAFKRAPRIFFQNMDDLEAFASAGLVAREQCVRLPGSGVDLDRFTPAPMPERAVGAPVFLLVARLLWDKGVGEFVDAARIVKATYPDATFRLVGFPGVDNPSAVTEADIEQWQGLVEYKGPTPDVRPFMVDADCVVLPSYREGVPRTLLEAAATMRPIITTDAPGCRDTVLDGVTGFMCQPKSAQDLADKMLAFLRLTAVERAQMGEAGRKRIEREFDERIVLKRYVDLLASLSA